MKVLSVIGEVVAERERQDAKWGEQNHRDVTDVVFHNSYGQEANGWKLTNSDRASAGRIAWDGILLEEVYEALAESDQTKLRDELIQVAAVAIAWVEAIDRRDN